MRRLTPLEVQISSVRALSLDPKRHSLTSIEAIAAALRRAASFLCPCPAPTLVRAVMGPLRGLIEEPDFVKTTIEDILEQIVAYGDFFEYHDLTSARSSATILYCAPRAFVLRHSGLAILFGLGTDQASVLPDDLESRVENIGYVRRLMPRSGENLREELLQHGGIELSQEQWLKAPLSETAAEHIARLDTQLHGQPISGEMLGLILLDSEMPVRYYRGRWILPKKQTGNFVARRDQAYGSPIWCYVMMKDGRPERFIDFPSPGSKWRGCDEAWHLQMAIDAHRQLPQVLSIIPESPGIVRCEVFSPVPMWAQRRWDAIGERVATSGSLFAFRLASDEADEEALFARNRLWMDAMQEHAKSR